MRKDKEQLRVRMDGYTRLCLTVIAVLLAVLIVGLWADHAPVADEAHAKRPEASTEVQILKAQKQTTAKLDELITLLKSGNVKVQAVQGSDKGGRDDSGKKK